jgi:serralysin
VANFFPYDPAFRGGVSVAGGDLNGDGRDDIIVAAGTGGGPHVRAFSGLDGRLLFDGQVYAPLFRGGVNVAVGDVNGDGFADIVTAPGSGGGPHVRAFSGRNGASLRSFLAYDAFYTGGVTVAAGDVDGDGLAEIVTGSSAGASHVRVFSGATGSSVNEFLAFPPPPGSHHFGGSVAVGVRVAVIDFDGDGRMDIVAAPGAGARPVVQCFRGDVATLLGAFNAYDPVFLGGVYVGG